MVCRSTPALLLLVVVAVAGCGAATPAPGSATPAGTTPPSPPPTASPLPTISPTPAPSPIPATTPAGSTPPAATPTIVPTPTPTPAPAAGFSCDYPFRLRGSTSSVAAVTDVRVGTHPGYDRVVYQFKGGGLPALRMDQVSPPFERDPSGLPLTVPGKAFVRIVLDPASGEGYARLDGEPTYTGPRAYDPGYQRLTSLVRAGDFEAQLTWMAGLAGPACYRVLTLENPARLVIDFEAP